LVLLLLPTIILSDYVDGILRVGDDYSTTIWTTRMYSIYQLPLGINTNAITFHDTTAIYAMRYEICPRDYLCYDQKATEVLVHMDMDTMKITAVHDLHMSERLLSQRLLPFGLDSRNFVYIVSSRGDVIRINSKDGHTTKFSALGSRISRGQMDIVDDNLYLSCDNRSILKVPLHNFSPHAATAVALSSMINQSTVITRFAHSHNSICDTLYIMGNFAGEHADENATIFHVDENQRLLSYQRLNSPLSHVEAVIVREKFVFALFLDKRLEDKDPSHTRTMTLYRLNATGLINVDNITFESREFAGHFFSKSSLYLYTYGAELIKINLDGAMKHDIMTILKQKYKREGYDPYSMPVFTAAELYNDDVALITAHKGLLIRVNLTEFCSDDKDCEHFPHWVAPITIIVFLTLFITILTLYAIKMAFQKRVRNRSIRTYYENIMNPRPMNESCPGTPSMSVQNYGAIQGTPSMSVQNYGALQGTPNSEDSTEP